MTEEQPFICPSLPMLRMMRELSEIEKIADEKERTDKGNAFCLRYVMPTGLSDWQDVVMIMTVFKLHAAQLGRNGDFAKTLPTLAPMVEFMPVTIEVIGAFYCLLCDVFAAGHDVFYVRLVDGKSTMPFDLSQTPENSKYITTKYCAHCKATPTKLLECGKCHRSAYCNKDCQREDWRAHHKDFCAYFASLPLVTPKKTEVEETITKMASLEIKEEKDEQEEEAEVNQTNK